MLALAHRFHGHNSLRPIYQKGKSAYSRNVKLLWLTAPKSYRVAIVVSKKVHKSAVVRNRIRRRIYALVAEFFKSQEPNSDLVFLVQNATLAELSAEELKNEVTTLLQKVR